MSKFKIGEKKAVKFRFRNEDQPGGWEADVTFLLGNKVIIEVDGVVPGYDFERLLLESAEQSKETNK